MAKQQLVYIAYLLRMWRTEGDGSWKASLENPHTGEKTGFRSITVLIEFLLEKCGLPVLKETKNKPIIKKGED